MTGSAYRSLVLKDLRELLPIVIVLLGLSVVGWVYSLVLTPPDAHSWAEFSFLLTPGSSATSVYIFVAIGFITGFRLFHRELANGTLPFLWGLPLARWHVYAAKLLTALAPLAGFQLVDMLAAAAVQALNPSGVLRDQFTWSGWAFELAVVVGIYFVAIAYGVFASYFRALGAAFAVLLLVAIGILATLVPDLRFLEISSLGLSSHRGDTIVLPGDGWLAHGVAATICVALAGWLWIYRSEPRPRVLSVRWRRVRRIGSMVGLVLASLVAVPVYFDALEPDEEQVSDGSAANETLETAHFQLEHTRDQKEQVAAFKDEADRLFERTEALLGTELGDRIVADLTGDSAQHLGRAVWKRLEISRSAMNREQLRSYVLVHETAHVLASYASDAELGAERAQALFFIEGLAEWAAHEIVPSADTRAASRTLAAAAWQRFDLDFTDIIVTAHFRARFDENLVYALGEAWTSALADACGRDAPGKLLRAMAKREVKRRVTGAAFWRRLLAEVDCNLTTVNLRLEEMLGSNSLAVEAIPRIVGGAVAEGKSVQFTIGLRGGESARAYGVSVKLRRDSATPMRGYRYGRTRVTPGRPAKISVKRPTAEEPFEYQIGVEFAPGERAFYTEWIRHG